MMTNSSQPVVLITGASSGIGKSTAELLMANGYRVFGTSREPKKNSQLAYEMFTLDVRSDESVLAAVKKVVEQTGRIDVLVNNAGYMLGGGVEENNIASVQAQFDTNFFGVLRVTNAVLPFMRKQRNGRIINISSLVGLVALPFMGLYASTKFAVEGISEALRDELRPFNIHVSLVEPGFTKTLLVEESPTNPLADYRQQREMAQKFIQQGLYHGDDPSVVAQMILKIAKSTRPKLRYRVGAATGMLTRLKRFLPEPVFEKVRQVVLRA